MVAYLLVVLSCLVIVLCCLFVSISVLACRLPCFGLSRLGGPMKFDGYHNSGKSHTSKSLIPVIPVKDFLSRLDCVCVGVQAFFERLNDAHKESEVVRERLSLLVLCGHLLFFPCVHLVF